MRSMTTTGLLAAAMLATTSASAAVIGFEAESGTFTTGGNVYNAVADPDASGGTAIAPSGADFGFGTNNADVLYELDFTEAGTYYLYARVRRTSGVTTGIDLRTSTSELRSTPITNGNFIAIWGGLNGATDVEGNIFDGEDYAVFNLSTGPFITLGFNGSATFDIAAPGTVEFQVSNRNDNVFLDAFVFSTDANLSEAEFLAIVPEPASLALVVAGLGLAFVRRRA